MVSPPAPSVWRSFGLLMGLLIVIWGAVPFLAAGTLEWSYGWSYALASALGLALHSLYVARENPTLAARRNVVGPGTKRWDLYWNWLFWIFLAGAPVVAGLEVRLGRVTPMSPWLWPLGVLSLAAGLGLSGVAMATNPFFEGTVRIQRELGHRVCDVGLYSRVRHPGYAGVILWALAGPLLLSSWRAFLPAVVTVVWVLLRTILEDATLDRELDGYAEYARRVRFRLVPFVW